MLSLVNQSASYSFGCSYLVIYSFYFSISSAKNHLRILLLAVIVGSRREKMDVPSCFFFFFARNQRKCWCHIVSSKRKGEKRKKTKTIYSFHCRADQCNNLLQNLLKGWNSLCSIGCWMSEIKEWKERKYNTIDQQKKNNNNINNRYREFHSARKIPTDRRGYTAWIGSNCL
jgi:hypothetical protein